MKNAAKTLMFEGTFADGFKTTCDFYDFLGACRFFLRVERDRQTKLLSVNEIKEQGGKME